MFCFVSYFDIEVFLLTPGTLGNDFMFLPFTERWAQKSRAPLQVKPLCSRDEKLVKSDVCYWGWRGGEWWCLLDTEGHSSV